MASYVPKYPSGLERRYQRELNQRAELLYRVTMRILRKLVLKADSEERQDAIIWSALQRALDAVKNMFNVQMAPDEDEIRAQGSAVERHARRQAERSAAAAARGKATVPRFNIPYREGPLIDRWVAENVTLIKSIDERWFSDVEKVIAEGIRTGRSVADVSADLSERYGVSRSRATLIAQDQTSKLNGKVIATRSQTLGITKFEWSTSRDDRVRPSHRKLEGKVFSWEDPPAVGLPGEDVRCRCVAISLVDEEDAPDEARLPEAPPGWRAGQPWSPPRPTPAPMPNLFTTPAPSRPAFASPVRTVEIPTATPPAPIKAVKKRAPPEIYRGPQLAPLTVQAPPSSTVQSVDLVVKSGRAFGKNGPRGYIARVTFVKTPTGNANFPYSRRAITQVWDPSVGRFVNDWPSSSEQQEAHLTLAAGEALGLPDEDFRWALVGG